MRDGSADKDSRLIGWLLHGPTKEDGTPGWFIGNILWWRTWATTFLVSLPFICGLYVLSEYSGFAAVMVMAIVGWIASEKATQVSPKYNVTKNY